jgi:hypothetical protein
MKKRFFLIVMAIFFLASQVPVYAGQGKGNGYGKGRGFNKQLRLRDGSCGQTQGMSQAGSGRKQNNRTQVSKDNPSEQPPSSVKSNGLQR